MKENGICTAWKKKFFPLAGVRGRRRRMLATMTGWYPLVEVTLLEP